MIAAITGANGFIGRHLVRRFTEAGWDARPVVRRDFDTGDLNNLMRGAAVIVHAAGATRAPSVAELRVSNVTLTSRVLDAARESGVPRVVFISSQAAAGPASSLSSPVTEEARATPVEDYGRSKFDAESEVRSQSNVETVIVRPAAVYGPGDRDFLAMFQLAQHGLAIHPGSRDHWLSIAHVRDVADGVFMCATSGAAVGQTYFLANEEPVQWAELFRRGAECADRTLRFDVNVPEPIVRLGAVLGDVAATITGHASLLTSGKIALSRPTFWVCSSEKARRELLLTHRVDLQTGLAETYDWYRANKWL